MWGLIVMKIDGDCESCKVKKINSVIIVWLLVLGIFVAFLPIGFTGVKALKYHSSGSAIWEDADAGGGVDYNGDTVGDKKITWHAIHNPHIVDNSFAVQDGYILEIEAGAQILLNENIFIQIGSSTGASLYANGTGFSPI